MNIVRDFPIIIISFIIFSYFSTGILFAKKSKLDLKSFALLGYATVILVISILLYSPLKEFLTKAANEAANKEIFELPYIISALIIALYFLIVFLYSKKEGVEFRSFVSLGYATSILVVLILFYAPVKNLLMRTARDATSIEIGNTKIILPIVAIHHKKNDIIKNAIESEKDSIKDTTTKIKNLKYIVEFIKLDIDIMKCKVDNFVIQNKSANAEILSLRIACYEEVLNKLVTHILPLIDKGEFENALEIFKKLDLLWGDKIRLNVPYYYTALGLIYSGIDNSEKCADIFKMGIKIFPNDVSLLHFNAGVCLTERGDLIGAIHYTKLAMAVLDDHLNDFANELNNKSILINQMIFSSNDEEVQRIIKVARSFNSKKITKPEEYSRIINSSINFWKYRLAYWYSLIRLEESDARRYANEIEQYMFDNNKIIPKYTDAIGLVKLVFAKNVNDIEEAKKVFKKAKKEVFEKEKNAAESSKDRYKNTLNKINLHLSVVEDVLNA